MDIQKIGEMMKAIWVTVTSEAAIARYRQIARFLWTVVVILVGVCVMGWEAWRTHQPIQWVVKLYRKAEWLCDAAKAAGEAEINDRVLLPTVNATAEAGYRLALAKHGFDSNRAALQNRIKTIPAWSIGMAGVEAIATLKVLQRMVVNPALAIVKGG